MDSSVVSANILSRRDECQGGGVVRHHFIFGKAAILAALATILLGAARATPNWVSSWAAAQTVVDAKDALPVGQDLTLRQLVRVTTGGNAIRVRISNAFGNAPLDIRGIHVARASSPASSRIDVASDKAVTFNGAADVSIPAGADYLSDPIAMNVPAFTTLA